MHSIIFSHSVFFAQSSRVKIAGYTLPKTKIFFWNLLQHPALFQLRFLWFTGDRLNGNRPSHGQLIICPWHHSSRRGDKLHQKELLFVLQEQDLAQVKPCEAFTIVDTIVDASPGNAIGTDHACILQIFFLVPKVFHLNLNDL